MRISDLEFRRVLFRSVPSGNFLGQEYKSNKEISTFCQTKFGIKFPLAEKSDVIGPNAIPLYKWAAAELGMTNIPKWNFHKYLIGRDGKLIAAFGTKTDPMDVKVTTAISAALAKRSEEHTSELQSLMRISYAVFCMQKKRKN